MIIHISLMELSSIMWRDDELVDYRVLLHELGLNKERGDKRMEDFMSTNQTTRPFFFLSKEAAAG